MKIISIGDLVTDFYYKNGKLIGVNGGMTSHNIIANLAKMGFKTAVYGACGSDDAGNIAIKSLEDIGVNTENITKKENLSTRCFHVSYIEENGMLTFKSKKRCPLCNEKKWYEESHIEEEEILKKLSQDDILVFDNLNPKNQKIIDNCKNIKMIDLGQYFELEEYTNEEIIKKIHNKFDLINLNERVEEYLKGRFSLTTLEEIYKLLHPKMIIVTRGKKGSDFVFQGMKVNKKLENPAEELDPTGAGDAFFSVFISEYIKKQNKIDLVFIDTTFKKATELTQKVVKSFGARGHIQKLYKTKKIEGFCTCDRFNIISRKQIKRCNINVNNLESRVLNALDSSAYKKLSNINFDTLENVIFIGTGGSFAGAKFSAKMINFLYGTNTEALYPRNVYYRNNKKLDAVFLFSYSGTTNDIIYSTSKIENQKKYVITKGEIETIITKTGVQKKNILSYRTGKNKGRERGFLSFEGALAPASLFLKLYFEKELNKDATEFIKESVNYWKDYFERYFKDKKTLLKDFLKEGSTWNIFTGDFTESAGSDLESKIIESGIYNCLVHEKKNFSHGRFINYEHLSDKKNIYLKQHTTTSYESALLEYLKNDKNIIIESRYDGIFCEYDLLLASQYLAYYISNFIHKDISKPTYTEDAMKIYFYKGDL